MTTATRIDPRSLRAATMTDADTMTATPPSNASRRLPLAVIRLDGGTQPRAALDQKHISDLTDDLRAGALLPPVDVMYDGENYWLFDGFHRWHAHKAIGGEGSAIEARIHQGDQTAAQWASFAVNKSHGLRRTTEDKQRAIIAALKHPNGASRSNREIGRHLGVNDKTVGEWRKKLESTAEIPQSTERTGADGRTIDTTNIGAAPRRDTYASGLPKLNVPLRMAVADTPPTQALGTEFTVSELIDLVHACATRTGMAPALDGTPFWFQLNADVAAAGAGKRKWSVINLRAAVNAFHPRAEHQTPDANVVPSDAAHTRQQGAPLGKCRACNRPLYDPAQAAQGIGACCAAKQAAGLVVDGDRPLPDSASDDANALAAADLQVLKSAPAMETKEPADTPSVDTSALTTNTLADVLRPLVTEFYEDGSDTWRRNAARDMRLNASDKDGSFWRRCMAKLDASPYRAGVDWTTGLLRESLKILANESAEEIERLPDPPEALSSDSERAEHLHRWIKRFYFLRQDLVEWGKLTGHHVAYLSLQRELDHLTELTDAELSALKPN